MFEDEVADYPIAVASKDPNGLAEAIRWCRSHQQPGQKITVWTHLKSNLRANPTIAALAARPEVEHVTARGGAYLSSPGPVLMAWPDQEDIGELQRNGGYITALCVITWNPNSIRPWVTHVRPEILGDGSEWENLTPAMDPVVIEAMKSMTITINHNNTISAGYEKDQVVATLLALNKAGYKLDGDAMAGWAVANGWSGKNPARLAAYVEDINAGKRPRTNYPRSADWIEHLRKRAAGEE